MSLLRRYFPRTYVARRNLSRARVRTALAILTVVIGVVAVGGLGVFGLAFEADQQETLGDIGTEVRVEPPGGRFGFGADDQPELDDRRLDTVEEVAGERNLTVVRSSFPELEPDEEYTVPHAVKGVSNPEQVYNVTEGEIPDDWDRGALIDQTTANRGDLEVGEPVTVAGRLQRIIAIIDPPSGFSRIESTNSAAVLPLELVDPGGSYDGVLIRTDDAREADEIAQQLEQRLNGPLRADQEQFTVESQQEEAEAIEQQFTSTNRFLIAVGSISLLIAAISIANVQLMSARERREEIGVLRAVGYGRLDILAIMVLEAAFMGLLAATIGVGCTAAAGAVINDALLGDPMAFQAGTQTYLLGAFAFGVTICVVAGLYPAWKASREQPADALQG